MTRVPLAICSIHAVMNYKIISFATALFLLFDLLKETLRKHLSLSGQKLEEFISQFISSLPSFFKDRLQLSNCES